jgi:hypothetical protein
VKFTPMGVKGRKFDTQHLGVNKGRKNSPSSLGGQLHA